MVSHNPFNVYLSEKKKQIMLFIMDGQAYILISNHLNLLISNHFILDIIR